MKERENPKGMSRAAAIEVDGLHQHDFPEGRSYQFFEEFTAVCMERQLELNPAAEYFVAGGSILPRSDEPPRAITILVSGMTDEDGWDYSKVLRLIQTASAVIRRYVPNRTIVYSIE